MKKLILPLLLLLVQFTYAQKITVTGTIKNPEGGLLKGAIVKDNAGDKTKTDIAGVFKLAVTMPATLSITCVGYRDTSVNVTAAAQRFDITLYGAVNIVATKDRIPPDPAKVIAMAPLATKMDFPSGGVNPLDNNGTVAYVSAGGAVSSVNTPGSKAETFQKYTDFDAIAGTIFPQFNPKEETQGSRYFFSQWEQGYVINARGALMGSKDYQFNYDKITGGLLATKDGHSAIEVDRDKVSHFRLIKENGDTVTFANVPAIDKNHYVQVLSEGGKYGIYKTISTKFEKANYTTDGVMTQGNNFDSYTDTFEYYLIDAKTGTTQKIVLKKKAIKTLLPGETDKLNKYVTDHSADTMDDSYIVSLGQYLNE